MRTRLILAAVALALFNGACGGDDAAPATDTQQDGAETVSIEVSAANLSFSPSSLSVPAGAQVEVSFTNEDEASHSMTSDDLGIDLEAAGGQSAGGSFTAPESGSAEFHCKFHPQMTGTIETG